MQGEQGSQLLRMRVLWGGADMVTFVTLFLSLVAGVFPVEVTVGEEVAEVEIVLDGRAAGVIAGPPWRLDCDFGPDLVPHELLAIARDDMGAELSRARQLVNVPRPRAETTILLERDKNGLPVTAQFVNRSVLGMRPIRVTATFDGSRLAISDHSRCELPAYDPAQTHLLTVETEYLEGLSSRADAVFGGSFGATAQTELSAIPVTIDKGAEIPSVGQMTGWFRVRGEPLRVVAVERAGFKVLVVRDQESMPRLTELAADQEHNAPVRYVRNRPAKPLPLESGTDRLLVVVPRTRISPHAGLPVEIFPVSRPYDVAEGDIPWLVTHLRRPRQARPEQRLADAIAVAGLRASAAGRPRAVLLILHGDPVDNSKKDPAGVRRYLGLLRVPHYVWSTAAATGETAWGPAEDGSTRRKLRQAGERLEQALARQWIVWLEGLHLPHQIELSAQASGLTLVCP